MWIVIGIVVVALVVAVVVAVRRGAGSARARIEESLASLDVRRKDKADFYGVASRGEGQVRSLGTLALTPDELVFLQFVPESEVRVPLKAITHVEIARSFLDKTVTRDLMVVTWKSGEDDDRVAFDVPDMDAWRSELRRHI